MTDKKRTPGDVPWWLIALLWVASIPASIYDWIKRQTGR